MKFLVSTLGFFALSAPAFAAADLRTTNTPAASTTMVYDAGRWYVDVANIGNKNASNVSLTIQLPVTHTSPSVYVMGVVGAKSSSCVTSGTTLVCSLGTINRSTTKQVYFDITLPESSAALTFVSTVTTTSSENSTTNNVDTDNATLAYDNVSLATFPTTADVDHCTGTGLTAYYECTLFPSSISSHQHTFESSGSATYGTISIAGYPDYAGTWSISGATLVFEYTELGVPVANFSGRGVGTGCWEGLTTFPGSPYVSPYSVCF